MVVSLFGTCIDCNDVLWVDDIKMHSLTEGSFVVHFKTGASTEISLTAQEIYKEGHSNDYLTRNEIYHQLDRAKTCLLNLWNNGIQVIEVIIKKHYQPGAISYDEIPQ